MLFKNFFKKIGEDKNWKYGNYGVAGVENGYPVILYCDSLISYAIIIGCKFQSESIRDKVLDELETNRKNYYIKTIDVYEDGIYIKPIEFWRRLNYSRFQVIISHVTKKLAKYDVIDTKVSMEDL